MVKWLVRFFIGVLMVVPGLANAQAPVTLDRVRVDLWPEYDRPDMLVIYHIFLPSDASLPASLTLKIPVEANLPSNLAYRDQSGELYNLSYTRAESPQWVSISFKTPSTEVQMEYYDPRLEKKGNTRTFTYTWVGDYTVNSLSFQVQQPISATDIKISPSTGNGLSGGNGLTYYDGTIGALKPGQQPSINLVYDKSNDNLSIQALSVGPTAPINSQTPGRSTIGMVLPWILGGFALLLIAGAGWWLLETRRIPWAWQLHKVASTAQPLNTAQAATGDEVLYCHHCGRRASPEDIFCRSCGVKLKRE